MGEYIKTTVDTKDKNYKIFTFQLNNAKWSIGDSALLFKSEDRTDNVFTTKVKDAKELLLKRLSLLDEKTNIGKSLTPIINEYLKKLSFFNDDCVITSDCSCLYNDVNSHGDIIKGVERYEDMFEKIKVGYKGKKHSLNDDFKQKLYKIEQYLLENIVIVNDVIVGYPVTPLELNSVYNLDNMYDGFYVVYPIYLKHTCPSNNVFAYLSQFPTLFPMIKEANGWKVSDGERVLTTYLVLGNIKQKVDEEILGNSNPSFYALDSKF